MHDVCCHLIWRCPCDPITAAYKYADGKKIDGRRVLVDVERGRTIKGWRPRRLGGGLGGTRKGGPDVNTKYSGREEFSRFVPVLCYIGELTQSLS